jgi:hypothetical protein
MLRVEKKKEHESLLRSHMVALCDACCLLLFHSKTLYLSSINIIDCMNEKNKKIHGKMKKKKKKKKI